MRSTESAALAVLRGIEDEGSRRRAAEIVVHVHGSIALYVLNHKRVRLAEIEARFGMHVTFQADDSMIPPAMRIEKIRALLPSDVPAPIAQAAPEAVEDDPDDAVMEADDIDSDVPEPPQARQAPQAAKPVVAAEDADEEAAPPGETAAEGEQRKRRRRRRRGGRREDGTSVETAAAPDGAPAEALTEGELQATASNAAGSIAEDAAGSDEMVAEGAPAAAEPGDDATMPEGERKRRGRRGGRRRRREPGDEGTPGVEGEAPAAQSKAAPEPSYSPPPYTPPAYVPPPYVPSYAGPTPANPFGGDSNAFSFFDAVEEMDETPPPRPAAVVAPVAAPVAVQPVVLEPAPAPKAAASIPEAKPAAAAATVVGPAVVPIVLGAPDAPEVEKKKGWWRR